MKKDLERNLNSEYSILSKHGKDAMLSNPSSCMTYMKEAGKKKKNEDKERSKQRVEALGGK